MGSWRPRRGTASSSPPGSAGVPARLGHAIPLFTVATQPACSGSHGFDQGFADPLPFPRSTSVCGAYWISGQGNVSSQEPLRTGRHANGLEEAIVGSSECIALVRCVEGLVLGAYGTQ